MWLDSFFQICHEGLCLASAKNFLKLCKVKYYNFCLFHSVQQNLVAQTGDPTATGRGGMSVYGMVYGEQARYFDMEVTPRIKHRKQGLLSMVNNGNGRHGSQFFITLGENLDYLDGEHTVFGEVAEGLEVLEKLNEAYCDDKHRPYRDIRIFHTVIIDDPFDDPEGLVIPEKSPEPTKEMLESDRIGVDEEVDDTKGMTVEEIQELQAEREAKANAQLLEMVGDIPEADVKPPDNVLFVCKLNPVTTDEDLEMIFSRFGPILSCEVIKDQKTKESLQYAFIEFEEPQHCENAYFKMDNVLIDDRRIHVDFSQSVSKLRPSAAVNKAEEEKKGEQPKYVLKDQRRGDNNYDLVFEHDDLPQASAERRKSKKDKPGRQGDWEQEEGSKEDRKKDGRGRNGGGTEGDKDRDRECTRHRERKKERRSSSSQEDKRNERKREKKSPSSEEDGRKRRKQKDRSPSSEEDRRMKKRKGGSPSSGKEKKEVRKRKERSPSSEEDRRKERKRKERSPSSQENRRKERKRKERSPSSEEDRRKERKRKERSLSSEEDRRKERKMKERSPSSEEDRRKERKRKERSPSPEEDRRKERKRKERSPSSEEDRRKERRKKERSPSMEEERRKKKKGRRSPSSGEERKKKKKHRRSSSPEEDRRKGRKKEERRRGDHSSSSHRDRGTRDRR
ncbi:peptidyl-prolyl cis-trans isomerase-like 4 isoform X2 [Babylonia areolata]|uniref:peptidyl-prolyl cis-trans isomerase-like 4 isoform X2 n=1 Tax=Babylonia areolata TaxID=304850 RepID=UPI003FD652E4